MVLEGGLKWTQMGLSPKDMSVLETKFAAARDIAFAFGVPPQLLGIPGDNTYSNMQEARLAFWEDTVMPLLDFIGREVTDFIGDRFGGVELRANFDNIPAIAEKRRTLFETANGAAFLTTNEKREIVGYGPIDGGDEIVRPMQPQETPQEVAKSVMEALAYG